MNILIIKKINHRIVFLLIVLLLFYIIGCQGGSDSEPSGDGTDVAGPQEQENGWEIITVKALDSLAEDGLLSPRIQVKASENNRIHISYFETGSDVASDKIVKYMSFDVDATDSLSNVVQEIISDSLDNCLGLSLTLDGNSNPLVAYQGGEVRAGGQEEQSDVMISVRESIDTWTEYTGAVGNVERNPVFQDGLAGADLSIISDQNSNLFLSYQFYYEGIDAMNSAFPDLQFVSIPADDLDAAADEEQVEGNIYNTNGTADTQNFAGGNCRIILDKDGDPVVFYYAKLNSIDPDQKGLRVAKRKNGTWEAEWVDTGFEVEHISVAQKYDGSLAVVYSAKEYEDDFGDTVDYCLVYVEEPLSEALDWEPVVIDEISFCGRYCSLNFDSSGNPAIGYFEEMNRSKSVFYSRLKLAQRSSENIWHREVIASANDIELNNNKIVDNPGSNFFYIGKYNHLWFDDSDTIHIISYSNMNNTIYLFRRDIQDG